MVQYASKTVSAQHLTVKYISPTTFLLIGDSHAPPSTLPASLPSLSSCPSLPDPLIHSASSH